MKESEDKSECAPHGTCTTHKSPESRKEKKVDKSRQVTDKHKHPKKNHIYFCTRDVRGGNPHSVGRNKQKCCCDRTYTYCVYSWYGIAITYPRIFRWLHRRTRSRRLHHVDNNIDNNRPFHCDYSFFFLSFVTHSSWFNLCRLRLSNGDWPQGSCEQSPKKRQRNSGIIYLLWNWNLNIKFRGSPERKFIFEVRTLRINLWNTSDPLAIRQPRTQLAENSMNKPSVELPCKCISHATSQYILISESRHVRQLNVTFKPGS